MHTIPPICSQCMPCIISDTITAIVSGRSNGGWQRAALPHYMYLLYAPLAVCLAWPIEAALPGILDMVSSPIMYYIYLD